MANKAFQIALEAATDESNTEENWDRIIGKGKLTKESCLFLFEESDLSFQRFVIMLEMAK